MAVAPSGLRPLFLYFSEICMPDFNLHPSVRLVAWLLLLVAVQSLRGTALAAACLATPLLGARVIRRGARLVWRTRWLLISLLLIFSWGVAGDPLWDGMAAPSREGVMEGLNHMGRLLLVLVAVAAFLEAMPLADLLAATHALLRPLRRLGIDFDRGVVRLMLVLRYVETLPRPRDWKTLLDAPERCACELVDIEHRALRWTDYLFVLGLAAIAALFFLR